MQHTARRYDDIRPVKESEVRMENATGDPMMTSDNITVIPQVKAMALTGTSQPGRTLAKKAPNGEEQANHERKGIEAACEFVAL
ncbi:hypothetical protein LTR01_005203 [Friedmanniomyces endolithicus]|nr:hypothetical protein LTR01_005203 [Friedmanniomyces endolithicus]